MRSWLLLSLLALPLSGCAVAPITEEWGFRPSPPRPASPSPVGSRPTPAPLAASSERSTPASASPEVPGRPIPGVTVENLPLDALVRSVVTEAGLGSLLVVPSAGEWPVVSLREPRTLSPDEVCSLLSRLSAAHAASFTCSGGVAVLARLERGRTLQVLRLRERRPSELAGLFQAQSSQSSPDAPVSAPLRVIPDDATRSLVLIGSVSDVAEAGALVGSLDVSSMAGMVYRFVSVQRPASVLSSVRSLFPASVAASAVGDGVLLAGARGEIDRSVELLRMVERQSDRVVYRYTVASLDPSRCAEYAGVASGPASSSSGTGKPPIGGGSTSSLLTAPGAPSASGVAPAGSVPPRFAGASLSSVVVPDGVGGLDLVGPSASAGPLVRPVEGGCVLRGTPGEVAEALEMLRASDRPPVRVHIEAALLEAAVTDGLALGLRGSISVSDDVKLSALDGSVSSLVKAASGVFTGQLVSGGVRAVVEAAASATSGRVRVLSSPSVVVDAGSQAQLAVGDQVPVIERQQTGLVDDSRITNSITYRDVGVILRVTPEVRDGGRIKLRVTQEVSDAVKTNSSGIDSPTITRRGVDASLTVADGQTVVLGGLLRESVDDGREDVPGLSQVPVLGGLFSYKSQRREQKDLALVITARIVEDVEMSAGAQAVLDRIARLKGRGA